MNGLALVSKQWNDVVGNVMNSQALNEIIAFRDLFKLKRQALDLNLESVCRIFVKKLKAKLADEFVHDPDRNERYAILELVFPHYGGSYTSIANLVVTE